MSLKSVLGQTTAYDSHLKQAFKQEAMRALRKLAKDLGLEKGTYDIRFNAGGIAVSGEATLHAEHIYVQIGQSCAGLQPIMYRTCAGRKDYHGGRNHFCGVDGLKEGRHLDNMRIMASGELFTTGV